MMKKLYVVFGLLSVTACVFSATLVSQPGSEGTDVGAMQASPSGNFGNSENLMMNFGPSYECRAFLSWDLASIPAGSTINTATLEIWVDSRYPNATNYNFGVYRVTASWTEGGVTWNNQPAYNATAYDTKMVTGAAGSLTTFDVKNLVAEWVAGTYTNYGFCVKRVDMNNPTNWPYFCAGDNPSSANRPRISIDYTPATGIAPSSLGRVKATFK